MAQKDKRYRVVKRLIEIGDIERFEQIFETITPYRVQKDYGIHNYRLTDLMVNVEGWRLEEIFRLAELFDVDEKAMLDLMYNQHLHTKKNKAKKK